MSLLAKKNDEIYKLKNNGDINDTNPSHVNESIHQEEHMKQQRIKTQIILNPDFKKRPVTEKTVLHEVIVGNKQQQFHLKEIERAVYYLSKEITNKQTTLESGNENSNNGGSSVVGSIISFLSKKIEEMKNDVSSIDVKEIEEINTFWSKGTFVNPLYFLFLSFFTSSYFLVVVF